MQAATQAIETIGTIDAPHHLVLDETLPITGPTQVRVIILLPEESDLNEIEWLRAAATNPAFDFLKNPQEDIYTLADGDRFVDRSMKPQHTDQVKANENHNNRSKTNAQTA